MTEKIVRARLRESIIESGYRQRFVAERAGWTNNKLSRLLRGGSRMTLDDYFTVCRVIQIDPRALLEPDD